jgi:hypothetical protein
VPARRARFSSCHRASLQPCSGVGTAFECRLAWDSNRRGERTRLGMIGLPGDLAERLNVMAQELGVPVSEVIRRALR